MDGKVGLRLGRFRGKDREPSHDVHTLNNLAEDDVDVVEVGRGVDGDEPLAAVLVGPADAVPHAPLAVPREPVHELVLEVAAPDRVRVPVLARRKRVALGRATVRVRPRARLDH